MVCWIEGGAGFFLFMFCLAAPSSYRVDPAGSRGVDLRRGGSMSSSLPDFPAGARGLYPLARGCTESTGAPDGTRADGVLDRGRRRLFSF